MKVHILCLLSAYIWTVFCQSPMDISLYPADSLLNPGAAFPFGGSLPSPRVQHVVALVDDYLVVHGGYDEQGSVLEDVNLYHIPTKVWHPHTASTLNFTQLSPSTLT
ncbi:hypothetical protein EON63_15190 [archaeon]|nr:MAG: hypothetical protein EON63_15190 [archaeon]